MNPGVYVIAGGGFTISGNAAVIGSSVLIYNAGSSFPASGGNFGGVSLSGNGPSRLTAPTTGPYAGVLLFQSRDNTRALAISGNGEAGISGTIYAPSALLAISGNASESMPLVVDDLTLSGNASSTDLALGSDSVSGTAGQSLPNLYVRVNNSNGDLTAAELSRIGNAIAGLNAFLKPYSVSITLVGPAQQSRPT